MNTWPKKHELLRKQKRAEQIGFESLKREQEAHEAQPASPMADRKKLEHLIKYLRPMQLRTASEKRPHSQTSKSSRAFDIAIIGSPSHGQSATAMDVKYVVYWRQEDAEPELLGIDYVRFMWLEVPPTAGM